MADKILATTYPQTWEVNDRSPGVITAGFDPEDETSLEDDLLWLL
jgi:hypothetical protein